MSLQFKLEGDILEVKETICGFHNTKVSFWYYDIANWMKSSHGKQGDRPDRQMTHDDISWVKRHYLPKVGK